jgi:adenylate cyclase
MAAPSPDRKLRVSLVANQDRGLIGKHIRAEMAKRGLTQAKLGEISAYDERTIRNVLKGLPVKDSTLYEICASLEIDLSKLPLSEPLGLTDRKPNDMERASVAVLPFQNLSRDATQDYFVDGIVEDIITELSRFSELVVIARNSTFQFKDRAADVRQVARDLGARYVLEGTVRRSDQRVRITTQLINATSGVQHWAERYDRELKDIFAVQDEVARATASVLVAHVNKAEAARSFNKPPETWEAYDYCLRGTDLFSSFPGSMNVERIYEARRHFERSLSLDPTYARAHAMLAATDMATWTNPLDDDLLNPAALDRAYRSAQRAVQLDPNLPRARGQLGHVLLYKREHDAAIAEFERACALNPNFSDWRFAAAVMYAGEPDRAADIVTTQMLRDPFYPVNTLVVLGQAYFVAKRYAEAVPALREAIIRAPDFRPARLFLGATYSRLERLEDARVQARHVLRLDPGWTISGTPKWLAPFKDIEGTKHFIESLRVAGLPE